MDTDKILTPFVSDDVVNECFKNLEEVWSCTEYEQLLTEVKVKADKKAESEATKNMRLRYDAVGKCLNQLEAAAGDNKVWWERLMYDLDDRNLYPYIDVGWFDRNNPKMVVSIDQKMWALFNGGKELHPEVFFRSLESRQLSPIDLCMEVCEVMGVSKALTGVEAICVARQMKALRLYIALRNERDKLEAEAALYGIPFEKPEKHKPEEETKPEKPKPMSKEQWAEATLEQKKRDLRGKRVFTEMVCKIFDAAVEDGRFIEETPTGYRWIYNTEGLADDGTSLMYFLYKAYGQRKGTPWTALQTLFGVDAKNLKSLLSNLLNAKDADGNDRESWLTQDNPPEWGRPIKQFIDSIRSAG